MAPHGRVSCCGLTYYWDIQVYNNHVTDCSSIQLGSTWIETIFGAREHQAEFVETDTVADMFGCLYDNKFRMARLTEGLDYPAPVQ